MPCTDSTSGGDESFTRLPEGCSEQVGAVVMILASPRQSHQSAGAAMSARSSALRRLGRRPVCHRRRALICAQTLRCHPPLLVQNIPRALSQANDSTFWLDDPYASVSIRVVWNVTLRPTQEDCHFFCRLGIAPCRGDDNPLLPCRGRGSAVVVLQMRVAEQLPGGRIIGIERQRRTQRIHRHRRVANSKLGLAQ